MNAEGYLALWYGLASIVTWFGLHSESFVFLGRLQKEERAERGILIVQLVASWIVILAPAYLYENRMTVLADIVEPNMLTVGVSMLLLVLAGLLIPYTFHLQQEQNALGATLAMIVSIATLVAFALVVVVVLPLEVAQCPCDVGFYGTNCQETCILNKLVCSGHGECGSSGCVCDERFSGEFCQGCVNEFLYETNCSTCRDGYSLLFDCTRCETGRDPGTDCQDCVAGYELNVTGAPCTECKSFYFKPSALPSRQSYNEFLRVGSDQCTPCPEGRGTVCSGHGICQHYKTIGTDGTMLREDASGQCQCEEGYFGPPCDPIPAYDGENTESICNGHGSPTIVYEQEDIFQSYKETVCTCDDSFFPTNSAAGSACTEKRNELGDTVSCVYGYRLIDGACVACNGGGFFQACNSARGGGFCDEKGACQCSVTYDPLGNGGYTGADCKTCANNFYRNAAANDPLRCVPCPAAIGPSVEQACGGKGFCITAERIQHWTDGFGTDTDSDSYAAYSATVETVVDLGDLPSYTGQCLCRSGFSNIIGGSCN